jgi:hypothetical protein
MGASLFARSCCVPAEFALVNGAASKDKKEENVGCGVASGEGCARGAST